MDKRCVRHCSLRSAGARLAQHRSGFARDHGGDRRVRRARGDLGPPRRREDPHQMHGCACALEPALHRAPWRERARGRHGSTRARARARADRRRARGVHDSSRGWERRRHARQHQRRRGDRYRARPHQAKLPHAPRGADLHPGGFLDVRVLPAPRVPRGRHHLLHHHLPRGVPVIGAVRGEAAEGAA